MRAIPCYPDCLAQETGEPADCDCADRARIAEDAEMENQVDRLRDSWVDEPYERAERDRSRTR